MCCMKKQTIKFMSHAISHNDAILTSAMTFQKLHINLMNFNVVMMIMPFSPTLKKSLTITIN